MCPGPVSTLFVELGTCRWSTVRVWSRGVLQPPPSPLPMVMALSSLFISLTKVAIVANPIVLTKICKRWWLMSRISTFLFALIFCRMTEKPVKIHFGSKQAFSYQCSCLHPWARSSPFCRSCTFHFYLFSLTDVCSYLEKLHAIPSNKSLPIRAFTMCWNCPRAGIVFFSISNLVYSLIINELWLLEKHSCAADGKCA